MPIHLLRKLFRERRRIALVVVLAFVGVRLTAPGPLATPASAAAAALGLGALAAVLSLGLPRLRSYSEAVALAGAAFAGLVTALPGSALDPAGPDGSPLVAVAFLLGLTALARGLRQALRGLGHPVLHNRRFKARAGSRVDIYRLWYGLVPGAALSWGPGASGREPVAEAGLRIGRVCPLPEARTAPPAATDAPRAQGADGEQGAQGVQILEVEQPFHIRLRAAGADRQGLIAGDGVSEIFFVELGDRRLVLFAHEFSALPLGRALLAWLDDQPGRMLDRRLALIERRAGAEQARRGYRPPQEAFAAWEADAAREGGGNGADEAEGEVDAATAGRERTRNAS